MRIALATDAGTPGWPNEDFAAASPGAAVLLDGATSRSGADIGCVHGVAWYARVLGTTLLAAIVAEPRVPLARALAGAIGEVRALHAGTCDLGNPDSPAATVTAVRGAAGGAEYLVLSDSSIAADYGDSAPPVVITDTHPAAGASPAAAAAAATGTLPPAGLRGIALLSDGATRITDTYGLLSWPAVIGVVRDDGPGELIRLVRAAEAGDSGRVRWPRFKASDDATAVYWQHDGADG